MTKYNLNTLLRKSGQLMADKIFPEKPVVIQELLTNLSPEDQMFAAGWYCYGRSGARYLSGMQCIEDVRRVASLHHLSPLGKLSLVAYSVGRFSR
jgi:hypothetical protein